ncbi:uncharacterized protein BDZ99DRAFT_571847 [Mytilinidion resinicola]|uniref:Uncharacterized protein n=1 Tax=Mytilinidion resinicola TaxID=574789 RepID=A0A6A6YJM6_9PEZI|nr:uncharacterized protein BDZ99DRAFT_571847 [Mytilinidion resinicola]KAF2809011.1 hypothetical protein BDZ99DRAFT_571847 [Mytilinidion resinicola]
MDTMSSHRFCEAAEEEQVPIKTCPVETKKPQKVTMLRPYTGPILNDLLLKHGMIGPIPPVDESDLLDNEIDPVFQRSNWVLGVDEENISNDVDGPLFKHDKASEVEMDKLWEMMIPAFRLATMLIRNEKLQDFRVKRVAAYKDMIPKEYADLSLEEVAREYLNLLASRLTFMFWAGDMHAAGATFWNKTM